MSPKEELERLHRAVYQRSLSAPGEFDVWQDERVWPEHDPKLKGDVTLFPAFQPLKIRPSPRQSKAQKTLLVTRNLPVPSEALRLRAVAQRHPTPESQPTSRDSSDSADLRATMTTALRVAQKRHHTCLSSDGKKLRKPLLGRYLQLPKGYPHSPEHPLPRTALRDSRRLHSQTKALP